MNQLESRRNGVLIGRIILGNFLELSLRKFLRYIRRVESTESFRKLLAARIIVILRNAPDVRGGMRNNKKILRVPLAARAYRATRCRPLACARERRGAWAAAGGQASSKFRIDKSLSNTLGTIHRTLIFEFAHVLYTRDYDVNNRYLEKHAKENHISKHEREQIRLLLHRVRRINTRNRFTAAVVKCIIEYQSAYLKSGDILKLSPLSQQDLAGMLSSNREIGFKVDVSCISRLLSGLSILTPWGECVALKDLLPNRKVLAVTWLEKMFRREQTEVETGKRDKGFDDYELGEILQTEIGLVYSTHTIRRYRQEIGVRSHTRRLTLNHAKTYPGSSASFSRENPLSPVSVKEIGNSTAGVYELRLSPMGLEYPKGYSNVFYIGSAQSLRKRLLDHISKNGKNGKIRDYINAHKCSFRFIKLANGWRQEEKRLYALFAETFGSPPVCNRISP